MGLQDSELHTLAQSLAYELRGYARQPDVVVLALQPGVVPLATEVARALQVPLDLFLVRPLVLPESGRHEIGIIASGGVLVLDSEAVRALGIPAATIATAAQAGARKLARREQACRGEQPQLDLRYRQVVVLHDGALHHATLRMVVTALRRRWTARVILASPTLPIATFRELLAEADEIVTALVEEPAIADRAWADAEAEAAPTR